MSEPDEVTDPMTGMPIPADTTPPTTPAAPVRSKALPPGRYWVTAFGDKQEVINQFFRSQSQSIRVEHTEDIPSTTDFPQGSFYIFNVSASVPWPASQVGFATIASASIQSLADTVSRPPVPPSTTQQLEDALEEAKKKAGQIVTILAWGVGAFVGIKLFDAFKKK